MLPLDYADRGVARQKRNINILVIAVTFFLVAIGALRAFQTTEIDGNLNLNYIHAAVIFLLAVIIPDLASENGIYHPRISTISSFSWPLLITLAITSDMELEGYAAGFIFLLLGLFSFNHSKRAYSDTILGRRYRSILSGIGLSTSLAIVVAQTSNVILIGGLTGTMAIPIMWDFFYPNPNNKGRRELMDHIDQIEGHIIEISERGLRMDQAISLLKLAREEGWSNTENGKKRLAAVEREMNLVVSHNEDLLELRASAMVTVDEALEIAPSVTEPTKLIQLGDNERELGSFREAEQFYRSAHQSAHRVCTYWEQAAALLSEAEEQLESKQTTQNEAIQVMISNARNAMQENKPDDALKILEAIPNQLQSLEDAKRRVEQTRADIEREIQSSHRDISSDFTNDMESIDDLIENGEFSTAMGLLDSMNRKITRRSECRRSFEQSIKQKTSIIQRTPEFHRERIDTMILESIEHSKARSWEDADNLLKKALSEVDSLTTIKNDSEELLTFLESEWIELRKRLDSNKIGPENENRRIVEKLVSEARSSFDIGSYHTSREHMGSADEVMELLRRLV